MDHIVVTGMRPYDGRYPWDIAAPALTVREWKWIKEHSGYYPATFIDGLRNIDAELMIVVAVLAIRRAGAITDQDVARLVERFQDVQFDEKIELVLGETEEEDADPPASSSGNGSSSADDGTTSSETSTTTPPPGGDPRSAFSEFDLIRSAT